MDKEKKCYIDLNEFGKKINKCKYFLHEQPVRFFRELLNCIKVEDNKDIQRLINDYNFYLGKISTMEEMFTSQINCGCGSSEDGRSTME